MPWLCPSMHVVQSSCMLETQLKKYRHSSLVRVIDLWTLWPSGMISNRNTFRLTCWPPTMVRAGVKIPMHPDWHTGNISPYVDCLHPALLINLTVGIYTAHHLAAHRIHEIGDARSLVSNHGYPWSNDIWTNLCELTTVSTVMLVGSWQTFLCVNGEIHTLTLHFYKLRSHLFLAQSLVHLIRGDY